MEISVGMYVRTDDGYIGKYLGNYKEKQDWLYYFDNEIIKEYDCEAGEYRSDCLYKTETSEQIIKASFNIIDLIEVGDYVNGARVTGIGLRDIVIAPHEVISYKNIDIKSIVTHEQFSSMEYKLGGE